jgi:twitching motility protein PilT
MDSSRNPDKHALRSYGICSSKRKSMNEMPDAVSGGAFEPSEQGSVRLRLAETLLAIISQRLVRRADGQARVVACEIMRRTQSIQDCIADPLKTDFMKEYMEKGRELYGMQTFDQHLTDLYTAGIIDVATARAAATSAADFERNLVFK